MSEKSDTLEFVKDYYGKVLQQTDDLQTNACTSASEKMPPRARAAAALLHDEVVRRYYGCGLVVPEAPLDGIHVLDMGCGVGRDCFIFAALVGEKGHVTGLDMTEEQLQVARQHEDFHRSAFGYALANTSFICGYMERLQEAGVKLGSYDLIVSNCVVNLAPDKGVVLREAFSALKEGGEFYFSDVYSEQELSAEIRANQVLWGECIAGALSWRELHRLAQEAGFQTPRLVRATPVSVDNPKLQAVIGPDHKFVSATYRLFKLSAAESLRGGACEVVYEGGIDGSEDCLRLDHQFEFKCGDFVRVDAPTARILRGSRFADYFSFQPKNGSQQDAVAEVDVALVNPFNIAKDKKSKCCC